MIVNRIDTKFQFLLQRFFLMKLVDFIFSINSDIDSMIDNNYF